MAFNWQTFRTRALTAIIFVAVMLTGLLWNFWSFFLLFSIIHFGCWWEYLKLVEKINTVKIDIAIKLLLMLSGYILFLNIGIQWIHFDFLIGKGGIMISLKWLFFLGLAGLLLVYLFQNKTIPSKAKWMTLVGFAYISLSWGFMMDLYDFKHLTVWWVEPYPDKIDTGVFSFNYAYVIPVVTIISIWINDTMAYIVGSLIGKTPLSKVSPKKTWEGTMGGIILCIIVVGFLSSKIFELNIAEKPSEINSYNWYLIAAMAAIAGTFGDLLESKLKRMAGVKDSGSLMPGHGGFLDRFDSLLLATPFVWLYVNIFMH